VRSGKPEGDDHSSGYPYDLETAFREPLRRGDAVAAHEGFRALVEALQRTDVPTPVLRQNLHTSLVLVARDLTLVGIDIPHSLSRQRIARRLAELSSADALRGAYTEMGWDLLSLLSDDGGIDLAHLARRRIDERYTDPSLTVESLGDDLHSAPGHVATVFKETFDVTIRQYIRTRRLELGKNLLGTTDLSVKSVALQCGYETPSGFGRAFKRYTGVSPSEYRASHTQGHDRVSGEHDRSSGT